MTVRFKEKHPNGFKLLLFSELWERFAFYSLQSILILFMSRALGFSDDEAFLLFACFQALLLLTPVIGGYVADKYLGIKQSIYVGGVLFFLGYLSLVFPFLWTFYLGLSIVAVANGFFKPNMMTILGELYSGPKDHRREAGYTLFYMGMNIGATLPPIFIGMLVSKINWESGFLTAVVGIVIALGVFYLGRRQIERIGHIPVESMYHKPSLRKKFLAYFAMWTLVGIVLIDFLLHFPHCADYLVIILSLIVLGVVFFFLASEPREKRLRMTAALILTLISGGFWIFYAQESTSMVLFASRNLDLEILGIPLNPEGVLFFAPFFIIILSPLISKMWLYLEHREKDPSTPTKFAMGILLMSLGFLVLWIGAGYFEQLGVVDSWWIAISYFFQAFGEVLLAPVGLAMITVLAPHEHLGMMMGVWFLIQASAFTIGGELSRIASVFPETTLVESANIYSKAFFLYFILCLALAVVAFLFIPFLKKLMHASQNL